MARREQQAVIRPSFTLGGAGGGIAHNEEELKLIVSQGLDLSPVTEVLVEESIEGWKEYEMEVMRDRAGNGIIICSIARQIALSTLRKGSACRLTFLLKP